MVNGSTARMIMAGLLLAQSAAVLAEESATPVSATAAVEPAPAATIVAPAPAAPASPLDEELREFRKPYERKWRIAMSAGIDTLSLAVQRKFGDHGGLGLAPFAGVQVRRLDRRYLVGGLAVQWWRERVNRLLPGVVGWTLQAGPMGVSYDFARGTEVTTVARGAGVVAAYSVYATMPILNFIFDARPNGWIPHLTWELGFWGGWAGRMKNVGDTDVDGDGIVDHRDGERFVNPDGRSPSAVIGGVLIRSGIVWVF